MKIDCIGCLHGYYPELKGGDLLLVTGDLTARDTESEYFEFYEWLQKQDYKRIIMISGNHDTWIERNECFGIEDFDGQKIEGLFDSGIEFDGLKIWGSPWTAWFSGVNPRCKANMISDSKLEKKFKLIPPDIDILITHSPPHGILDKSYNGTLCGSPYLRSRVLSDYFTNLKLHAFSHIHEWGGHVFETPLTKFVNCSIMNENYQPVNKPVRIEL